MKAVLLKSIVAASIIAALGLVACGAPDDPKPADSLRDEMNVDIPDADIDLDALNEAAESIGELDLVDDASEDVTEAEADSAAAEEPSGEPAGDKTVYSYTDVYRNGNDIIVIPNGGMNSSTKLFNDKDLAGFLDYVDSTVLEKGRTINRDFFYEVFATMLVDKDLNAGVDNIEKNMIMSLAMANNFHDMDVKIRECDLDANNAADYRYQVTASGKDDTWIVNYGNRSIYFNNGGTEYSSDMFKDEYLALWLVAIEEYYGLN
ncbi:MAG: hypothetical protein K6F73_03825 [Lachnospiraceae bacterium]|nr:hypothetical protein [Lachnospiraceae bacterium]